MRNIKIDATEFDTGETVPDWLATVEPLSATAKLGKCVFAQPVRVIKVVNGDQVVIPHDMDEPIFLLTGSGGNKFATDPNVHVILSKDTRVESIVVASKD